MSSGVEDIDRGWRRIERDLRRLAGTEIRVGIQATDGELARIGAIHEFGTDEWTITSKQAYFMARRLIGIDPEEEPVRFWGTFRTLRGKKMRIPERSFIRGAVDEHAPRIREAMRRSFDRVVAGEATLDQQTDRLGLYLQDLIQGYAIDLDSPANAPLTRHVKQSQNPLVDTGNMIAAIRFVVRRG